MKNELQTSKIEIGVVGLGLMGCSIATCLLMAGHTVIAVAPLPIDMQTAAKRIRHHLDRSFEEGLIPENADYYITNLIVTENFIVLANCQIIMECTIEDIDIKRSMYEKIEKHVSESAIITSNTSAIPISILQAEVKHPSRFMGLHWAEPSHTTRFLEIICGDKTDIVKAEFLYNMAHCWAKEPTLVRKDIRGFITNRLMYSLYREACSLVENGYASIEDVDRACRNNAGYWMTLVGVFRWMDLTGVPAYHTVMKDLLPELSNQTTIPKLIDDVVKAGGKGTANANGFYKYTKQEAQLWEETFQDFSYEIRKLALKYPADVVDQKINALNNL
jgi:3-hydroxybutyryl-CoA dehydrogenase